MNVDGAAHADAADDAAGLQGLAEGGEEAAVMLDEIGRRLGRKAVVNAYKLPELPAELLLVEHMLGNLPSIIARCSSNDSADNEALLGVVEGFGLKMELLCDPVAALEVRYLSS
jgi:hypothetical protein